LRQKINFVNKKCDSRCKGSTVEKNLVEKKNLIGKNLPTVDVKVLLSENKLICRKKYGREKKFDREKNPIFKLICIDNC
jgi:hypothetical protein